MKGRLRHVYKTVLRAFIYAAALPVLWILRLMPPAAASAVGEALGRLAFRVQGRAGRQAAARVGRVFPEISGEEREKIAAENFAHFGRSLGELLSWNFRRGAGAKLRIEGLEILEKARKSGRGAVMLTGHFGNWELAAAAVAAAWPGFSVVARDLYDPRFSRMAARMRERFGVQTFDTKDVRGILRHLRAGNCLAALVDQDSDRVRNVYVSFFGERVAAPAGPVLLAARANSMLISALVVPEDGGYCVRIGLIGENAGEEAPEVFLEKFNRVLEDGIRLDPARWVWIHDRWRSAEREARA